MSARIYLALPEQRIVICLTPKAASSSIITALLAYYGIRTDGTLHLNPALPFISREDMEALTNWRHAMFVRNPFDRLVANYRFHILRTKLQNCANMRRLGFQTTWTFAQFLARAVSNPACDPHLALQCRQFEAVDFLGRIEDMGQDWDRFRAFTGIALPPIPMVNVTDHGGRSYREFYDDSMLSQAAVAYRADLEAYGYRF